MLRIILLLLLISCSSYDIRVGDCYSYRFYDVTYGIGWASDLDLQVYKIENRRNKSTGIYHDYIFFRPIIDDKYKKEVDMNPKRKSKYIPGTTGLIYMYKKDFEKVLYNINDGNGGLKTTGWSRFSFGEGTRNGITCNDIER